MSELYACVWADAHGSDGTLQAHEIDHKPYVYTMVGFLVRTDAVGVSIAFERGEDGKYRDITFVPRAIVIEEFPLGKLRKPRQKRQLNSPEPV
jgi:hypothetical protein